MEHVIQLFLSPVSSLRHTYEIQMKTLTCAQCTQRAHNDTEHNSEETTKLQTLCFTVAYYSLSSSHHVKHAIFNIDSGGWLFCRVLVVVADGAAAGF